MVRTGPIERFLLRRPRRLGRATKQDTVPNRCTGPTIPEGDEKWGALVGWGNVASIRILDSVPLPMSRSFWVRTLLVIGPVFLLWACEPVGESKPPFPVDNQTEWRRYLQGTWVYAGADPSGEEDRGPTKDSLLLRVTFRGDTLDFMGETRQGDWFSKRKATCAVGYGKPYELELSNCVRGVRLRRLKKDTVRSERFSVPAGSPRSKKLAYLVGSMFSSALQPSSLDSLRMMEKKGRYFYLTREQGPE